MKLHEIYFGSLSKSPNTLNTESQLLKKINETYRSFDNWIEIFKKIATIRGIGWALLILMKKEIFSLYGLKSIIQNFSK